MGRIEITKDTTFSPCVPSGTLPMGVVANLTAPAPTGCGDSKNASSKRWPESQPAAKSVESGSMQRSGGAEKGESVFRLLCQAF